MGYRSYESAVREWERRGLLETRYSKRRGIESLIHFLLVGVICFFYFDILLFVGLSAIAALFFGGILEEYIATSAYIDGDADPRDFRTAEWFFSMILSMSRFLLLLAVAHLIITLRIWI